MGNARDTGYLQNIVTYDANDNIVLPANLNVGGAAIFSSSVTVSSLIKSGGTSSQFLKADGSVDSNTYLTTGTASSTYLPLAGGTLTGALNGTSASFSGNLAIAGQTLSAWGGTFGVIQSYYGSYFGGTSTGGTVIGNNNYFDGTNYKYVNTDFAGQIQIGSGNILFRVAPSDTAGNNVTYTNALTIASTGAATFSSSVSASSFNANVSTFGTDISVNSTIRVGSAYNTQASIIFGDAGTPYWSLGRPAGSGDLSIASYALTALTIQPTTGNVGIGTANPSVTFNVGHPSHGIGVSYLGGSALPAIAGLFTDSTSGQQGYGSLLIKSRTDYAGYSINFYTAASSNVIQQRLSISSTGVIKINNFTSNGLVGTDAAGNLGVVNNTYTEIPTGTISYSMTAGSPWAINNSFPATIRDFNDDGMVGSGDDSTGSNQSRGVTFDLGSAKAVRKIVERGYPTKNLNTIVVQYSTDNSNWTEIHAYKHVYGNTQKDMEFNPTGAIAARYWRWFIDSWTTREAQNYYTYESIIYT